MSTSNLPDGLHDVPVAKLIDMVSEDLERLRSNLVGIGEAVRANGEAEGSCAFIRSAHLSLANVGTLLTHASLSAPEGVTIKTRIGADA